MLNHAHFLIFSNLRNNSLRICNDNSYDNRDCKLQIYVRVKSG